MERKKNYAEKLLERGVGVGALGERVWENFVRRESKERNLIGEERKKKN